MAVKRPNDNEPVCSSFPTCMKTQLTFLHRSTSLSYSILCVSVVVMK